MIIDGWHRPSRRFCESAHCVEVGVHASGYVNVRASWNHFQVAEFEPTEFGAFLSAVKAGEYDHMID